MHNKKLLTLAALGAVAGTVNAQVLPGPSSSTAPGFVTSEPSMLDGGTPLTSQGWDSIPLFTVSETIDGYQPVGILDGVGVFGRGNDRALVFVNHELNAGNGYSYALANGTELTGARISRFQVLRAQDGTFSIASAGPAYDTIFDRQGLEVTDPAQINETGIDIDGIARLCSSKSVSKDSFGFVDNIYFAGEENGKPFATYGGTQYALDIVGRELWAVPAMGRQAWENTTPLDTGDPNTIAFLCGDDTQSAPLYLYIGQKNAIGDGSFLDRNGLAVGNLYAWQSDNGDLSPEDFNGEGSARTGTFVEVTVQDPSMAGMPGFDPFGWADIDTLQNEADALGAFSFSRPEDLSTNPLDGTQAVFASTGRGSLYPSDNWGTTYIVDVDFSDLTATLVIIHDADGLPVPDAGIRSPDNLEWGLDGKIYIQEDRSTSPGSLFGATTGAEASIWRLDPITRVATRIFEIDRSVVVPAGSTDIGAGDIGNWESSGVIDATHLFTTEPREKVFFVTVQAHGIRDGLIGDNPLLDEGGQLGIITKNGND